MTSSRWTTPVKLVSHQCINKSLFAQLSTSGSVDKSITLHNSVYYRLRLRQCGTAPTMWHGSHNVARLPQRGTAPTTRHGSHNAARLPQRGTAPTTRHGSDNAARLPQCGMAPTMRHGSHNASAGFEFGKPEGKACWSWLLYILEGTTASRKCHIITIALIQ